MFSGWQVHDLLKMNFDFTVWQVGVVRGVMDKGRNFALSHLASSETKHKQEGVDNVRLSGSVWSDDGGERCVERSDNLLSCITLEVG